jgi:rRNA maturation protein Rpf1
MGMNMICLDTKFHTLAAAANDIIAIDIFLKTEEKVYPPILLFLHSTKSDLNIGSILFEDLLPYFIQDFKLSITSVIFTSQVHTSTMLLLLNIRN